MIGFVTDTLLWTGGLIVLVLLLRRPVARWLGASAAYSLWALPALRMLLPPITLPHWLAPTPAVPEEALVIPAAFEAPATAFDNPAPLPAVEQVVMIDWTSAAAVLWLAGSALFLLRRYALYFEMRRTFLADARPVGHQGRVRFVETPAVDGPVAFGVFDKVIALPDGFMASRDREGRDLALAHELAHHRGGDLLINMVVQPLFAIHWFNPLCWLGWQALRRDQEAACDARVIDHAPRERRAAYAAIIARFATRHPASASLALAAPMACPVLGGRSILHRLRSITMPDISPRRRWTGRALIGSAVLALPLTASISYAQDAPAPVAPVSPVAPVAPAAAPSPVSAPAAPSGQRMVKVVGDHPVQIVRIERRVDKDGKPVDRPEGGKEGANVVKRIVVRPKGEMSAEDRAEFESAMAEVEKELGPGSEFRKVMREQFGKDGKVQREIRLALSDARAFAPRVMVECRDGQKSVTARTTDGEGHRAVFVCSGNAKASAQAAIASAKVQIAADRSLSDQQRREVLGSLEEAEKGLREE